ncbi:hypothetical protein F4780DRAFT_493897 [Xylariomycetidae sp. FL0641]|nr:hypothetical protein F4780DRAFT_493897 [Xylariomycetidae sp. FL0641]
MAVFPILGAVLAFRLISWANADGNSTDCTARSLEFPSFIISDFEIDTRAADESTLLSFDVTNRVDDFQCHCEITDPDPEEWYDCQADVDRVTGPIQVQVDLDAEILRIHHLWICADMPRPTTIEALATTRLPPAGTARQLARASLLAPAAITPRVPSFEEPAYLRGHDRPGCTRQSTDAPRWEVLDLVVEDYWTTYVAGPWSGGLSCLATHAHRLRLRNAATGAAVDCPNERGDGGAYACAGAGADEHTLLTWDPVALRLGVEQVWYCDDEDPGFPYEIRANATVDLRDKLTCEGEWTADEPGLSASPPCSETRRKCEPWSGVVEANSSSWTPVRPYSLREPGVDTSGCTVSSFGDPRFLVETMSIFRNDSIPGHGNTSLTFVAHTPSLSFQEKSWLQYTGDYGRVLNDSEHWWHCQTGVPGIGKESWQVPEGDCYFKWDSSDNTLTMRESWICDDLDPDRQVVFNVTAVGPINFNWDYSTGVSKNGNLFADYWMGWCDFALMNDEDITIRATDLTARVPDEPYPVFEQRNLTDGKLYSDSCTDTYSPKHRP